MTRDEAKKMATSNWPTNQFAGVQPLTPASFVALCEKLGMLKLEEPKSAEHRAYCLLDEEGHKAAQILELLKGDGLKIVEKQ